MTVRALFACLCFLFGIAAASCGDGAAPVHPDARPVWLYDANTPDAARPIDGPPPDACPDTMCDYSCVNLTSNPDHCGECDKSCSPAAGCSDSDCSCPDGFIPATLTDGESPPSFSADGVALRVRADFVGSDAQTHMFFLNWSSDTVATGVDYDLAVVDTPTPRFFYNRSFDGGPSGLFVPEVGILQLSRVCGDGVAGTLTGATLIEAAFGPGGGSPIPDGCALAGVSVAFDYGSDCSSE